MFTDKNYTIAEAAKISRMSAAWWRKQVFEKRVRHLKVGARVFIPEQTLSDLFQSGIVEPETRTAV
jgi:hypothetical protein